MSRESVHASCVAFSPGPGGWGWANPDSEPELPGPIPGPVPGPVAVLLRGPSGAGKSDLALRLIDQGARLVSDDQTELELAGGVLLARSPATIMGQMEVRGLGVTELMALSDVPVGLVVDLVDAAVVERMPEDVSCRLLDVQVPLLRLDPFEASAPAKLRLALKRLARLPDDAPDTHDEADGPDSGVGIKAAASDRALILVTGMSGAGRSTALSVLEDLGYEAIDNLPLDLLEALIAGSRRPIAIGIDIRTRGFAVRPVLEQLDRDLDGAGRRVTLLYLDCDDIVLGRRYTETRRRHPLAGGRPVTDGIAAERKLISLLRARADLVIDTTALNPAELHHRLAGHFARADIGGMTICVTSFAYRNGLPRDADLVFDVRFLNNPHYDPALRPLTGLDEAVASFVSADPRFEPFYRNLTDLLGPLLQDYRREGKSYLTIALGCTGGRHRSVALAERLAGWLAKEGEKVTLSHRDLGEDHPVQRELQ